jgi:hypothetical protein
LCSIETGPHEPIQDKATSAGGARGFCFQQDEKSGLDPGRSAPCFFNGLASITKLVENENRGSTNLRSKDSRQRQLHFSMD